MDIVEPINSSLNILIDQWLAEDIGRGDLSGVSVDSTKGSAYILSKEKGYLCGAGIAKKIFKRIDESIKIDLLIRDGKQINPGDKILNVKGKASSIVAAERTALNIIMHLSGITTLTSNLVKQLEGSGIKLADTRKTTPGLRILEKYAFRCGGGINHRYGLDDAAMLKENHLAWSKSIEKAISRIRENSSWTTKVIVEAENSDQAEEAVIAGADGILLDEISPSDLKMIVPKLRALNAKHKKNIYSGGITLEASGVNPFHLNEYASTGVDLISTSAATTKSKWIDLSMRYCNSN